MQSVSRTVGVGVVAVLVACSRGPRPASVAPSGSPGLSRAAVDSLWQHSLQLFTHGKWSKALTTYERLTLELPASDTLLVEAHFRMGECQFAMGNQLQAAREFRRVSDDTPNHRLAPEALLRAGDAYADLWRRPELDPTYGQTALATYQELLNRYPNAAAAPRARSRIAELDESFAFKEYKAAQYYFRLKAYDSAILYLKDLAASYPRASITPDALLMLVSSYRAVGYAEDLRETCGYIRRFHPATRGLDESCPLTPDSTGAAGS